ncbi:hypothetical protein L1987_06096 [Smallanthus sonchifolius]|uniref:Uncharacterized protein n=1 Tax=Smallanthus sonchifolius TaxID=185202 RepID=A0ACB9JXA2_9ASTR|nr:hypothetical protein L1987_06096 [Smallanthus sonchifolius]
MLSVKLATAVLTIMVLIAFTGSGTMAQESGAAPAPSPSMESDGMVRCCYKEPHPRVSVPEVARMKTLISLLFVDKEENPNDAELEVGRPL